GDNLISAIGDDSGGTCWGSAHVAALPTEISLCAFFGAQRARPRSSAAQIIEKVAVKADDVGDVALDIHGVLERIAVTRGGPIDQIAGRQRSPEIFRDDH